MNRTPKLNFFSKHLDVVIVIFVILLCGILGVTGLVEKIEFRVYDALLEIKPATTQNPNIRLVNIDDAASGEMGVWPWGREILADVLVRLREVGAKTAVFDIEYISSGSLGIAPDVLAELPDSFSYELDNVATLMSEFSSSVAHNGIALNQVESVSEDLINNYIVPSYQNLYDKIDVLVRDNDEYFGKAIRFFGNAWLTINAADLSIKVDPEYREYLDTNLLNYNVKDPTNEIEKGNDYTFKFMYNTIPGFSPALPIFMKNAAGAGFTNVSIDSDGSRRRIELLRKNNDVYIAQLSFAPLLSLLDTKELERTKTHLVVKNALFPGEEKRRDISIPLDSHGRMLINWIPNNFVTSFKSDSVLFLIDIDRVEENLIEQLKNLETFVLRDEFGKTLPYYDVVTYLLATYDDLETQKQVLFNEQGGSTINDSRFDAYFASRQSFFSDFAEIFHPSYLNEIMVRLNSLTTEETKEDIQLLKDSVNERFVALKSEYDLYQENFEFLKNHYNETFCIIGHTAVASTDLGTTPFNRFYPNVGTHANVFNTIITEEFITPLEWYFGYIFSCVFVFLVLFLEYKKRLVVQNLIGGFSTLFFPILSILLMVIFRIYMPVIIPSLVPILSFLGLTAYRFINSEKDKSFLRSAFSTYLSAEVVNEIVSDPKKLTLGGEEKNITAIFTDVRGFSTISEKVTPTQLVSFLNRYLTLLSDIILENRGTIDKYEGDAIIGFFGAPISYDYHAWTACLSAIRMKEAEIEFNAEMLAADVIPMPVYTRIGINTGNMVVGNMGTDKKMNYTMMGNDVNLAARLEGVNKVYHTWILVSESTWLAADSGENKGKIVARRMDKVRVVGINKPVQLYNIVGLRSEMTENQLKSVDLFHQGLDRYLQRDFVNAKKYFDMANDLYPETVTCYNRDGSTYTEDGPASVFSARCTKNITEGIPANWDGVVNLVSK
ncbi:MAG: adenylate/guanylate cyclase domain-containing protein [Spirochaetaceae bacterium]|nr:adenylate/guanylate cyclase domain-containing protein [Spirochaetaceae bacterium]